jgi:hypothetical protein
MPRVIVARREPEIIYKHHRRDEVQRLLDSLEPPKHPIVGGDETRKRLMATLAELKLKGSTKRDIHRVRVAETQRGRNGKVL